MEQLVVLEFKENAIFRLNESNRMVAIAFENLKEEQLWTRPNGISNSVGNLILHLCGNITQYAISSLGETRDVRDRDAEFNATEGFTKDELLKKLINTVQQAKDVINKSTIGQLIKKREVQGFNFSGIGIIMHVVEHYSYHTGQIAFWIKQLNGADLGFYDGMDLNTKNED
ncbi:DinB family protein [Spongiivirga sp. MCCC 1A20706]|uniref:DinB family protein n=1 Tax=Spongiivirga sp. MCCC 1A20706 TaxID=3160963 RepID=UPI00397730A5